MSPEEELTKYINDVLPTWAGTGIKTVDISSIELPQNHWKQLRARLEEEKLIQRHVGGYVSLTSEGRHVASGGIGSYNKFHKLLVNGRSDQTKTNSITRRTYIVGAIVGVITLAILIIDHWAAWMNPSDKDTSGNKSKTSKVVLADTTKDSSNTTLTRRHVIPK